ncbi:MAG: DUF1656 domain-containing protein [Alteromonadaceae bacterium]|uniref:DUF1656 domain-containing protein n=1 Tax=unclassified Marinobacter TaxID=83889 RepID=UPI000C658945|nr:DUF1656 domain-containing protein [Marinobacter sp. BGYM27]MAA65619.1 DUF1656 domain-containing protein [Alteromonadaceae bacterium]MBH86194.1 DUF1656 domain-containing protein [Alteromonadaceae bacterium]MDG5499565.1 DUF1656 domain-containing protein [Marinobacter sp. BGYM27]|tara:strand:- start:4525 stop:4725 length:201 start_codon:yes stop_codon:yes gene_type:complete
MLHELGFGGMLFSPLVVMIPMAFVLASVTRLALHHLDWRRYIWKEAWFDVGLYVCYLALIIYFFGS